VFETPGVSGTLYGAEKWRRRET